VNTPAVQDAAVAAPAARANQRLEPAGSLPESPSLLRPLRHRNYRFYWLAQFPSVLAQNMQQVALAWLVLQLTNSPLLLGVTGLMQSAPQIALSFVGGAVADRMDRLRLLMTTQATTALLFLALSVLTLTERVQVWEVMLCAFLLGCVRSFDQPSRQALIPLVIPREEIPSAVPLGNTVWQGTRLVGPAFAGMLIYLIGVGHTFLVACMGFVLALGLFSRIRVEQPPAQMTDRGLIRNMLDGMNFIRTNQIFYALIGLTFFNSVFGMSYVLLLPIFARDILNVGSQGFGLLESAAGLGSLLGTIGVLYLARWGRSGIQALAGSAVFGALLIGFALSPSYALSLAFLFLGGAANQMYMTTINTSLQLNLPEDFRGRVMGVWGLTWSLMPFGGTIAGGIAEVSSPQIAIALGGALVVGLALFIAAALPDVRGLRQEVRSTEGAPLGRAPQ